MTTEQIINCWKHERELAKCVCRYFVDQVELSLVNETLELINRQQAENERLQKKVEELSEVLSESIRIRYKEAKSEAVKEFAERLKENKFTHRNFGQLVYVEDIDNLVKEMVGES